jgi:putative SOS response-associated peptidase YedK
MPLVLQADAADAWLSAAPELDDLASRIPALQAWPVDKRVNNARNEGSDLIDVAGDVVR